MYARQYAPTVDAPAEEKAAHAVVVAEKFGAVLEIDTSPYRVAKVRNIQACRLFGVLGKAELCKEYWDEAIAKLRVSIEDEPDKAVERGFDLANFSSNIATLFVNEILPKDPSREQEMLHYVETARTYADEQLALGREGKLHPYFSTWYVRDATYHMAKDEKPQALNAIEKAEKCIGHFPEDQRSQQLKT